jgi:hypothetical protein
LVILKPGIVVEPMCQHPILPCPGDAHTRATHARRGRAVADRTPPASRAGPLPHLLAAWHRPGPDTPSSTPSLRWFKSDKHRRHPLFSPTSPSSLSTLRAPPRPPPPLDFLSEASCRSHASAVGIEATTATISELPLRWAPPSTGFPLPLHAYHLPLLHILLHDHHGTPPSTIAKHHRFPTAESSLHRRSPSVTPIASKVARWVAPSTVVLTPSTLPSGRLWRTCPRRVVARALCTVTTRSHTLSRRLAWAALAVRQGHFCH